MRRIAQPIGPVGGVGQGANESAKLPHGSCGLDVVTDHVAHHDRDPATWLRECVIPIAADLGPVRRRQVTGLNREWLNHRRRGEQSLLKGD